VLLRLWKELRAQSVLQVITDLLLVSLLIYITGGVDSSLNFLYPLVIVVATILLPRTWAYLTSALAFLLYGAVLELCYFQIVPSYSVTHPGIRTLQGIIFINLFGYLAIAYLAGLLAAKLRQADKRLEYTRGELLSLQALHENIIRSTSSGLITTGLDGRITLVNASAEKLVERPETELLGEPIAPLFQDRLPQAASEYVHSEVRFVAPNGFRKTFRILASELMVPGRGAVGHVYTLDDLTQMRRLEREVRMQDRLAAVGRLSAAIAHEVRNPLTSIAGCAGLLSEMPDLSDEHRRLPKRHHYRLSGLLAYQAISLFACGHGSAARRHADPAGPPAGSAQDRNQDRPALRGGEGLCARRWRPDEAGVLEFLRKRGPGDEKRRHPDRGH
jgi:two-component system sensor histidine kinase PilS (NtrC family)